MRVNELTCVILNWRTPDYAVRAARALLDDGLPEGRLVVVDNGSGDGSAERMGWALPASRVLALDRNEGFARGNNLGAAALPGAAYVFVNSDAFLHAPGSLARLVGALREDGVGLAVPRLLNDDLTLQRSVVPHSTPLPELIRAAGLSRFVPNELQPRMGAHWDHGRTRDVQAAIGAVIAVRGDAWNQLGGFDERRFMYAEDLDLFRRAARLGWRTRFVAESEFVHLGGASATRRWGSPERAERVARAEAEMLRAHMRPWRARVTLALMATGVGVRALFHRVRGHREAAVEQAGWFRGYLRAGAEEDRQ